MKKILLTIASAITLSSYSQAPTIQWQKIYGGNKSDFTLSTIPTADGGYISVGSTESTNDDFVDNHSAQQDSWVAKLDMYGNTQWKKILGGTSNDVLQSIIQTPDGGYLAGGYSGSNDGDVSGSHGNADQWIIKLDGNGNIQWQKTIGGYQEDTYGKLLKTTDGGYFLAGNTKSFDGDIVGHHGIAGNFDYTVYKLDANGNILWNKTLGGSEKDGLWDAIQTNDGGYALIGLSQSIDGDITAHTGSVEDVWLVKLNPNGNIMWEKSYPGTDITSPNSIIQTTDGGFAVAGVYEPTSFSFDSAAAVIIKLDNNGLLDWKKNYGGSGSDYFCSIQEIDNGHLIIAGSTGSSDGDVSSNHGGWAGWGDCWLVNTDAFGNVLWSETYGGSNMESAAQITKTPDNGYILSACSGSNDFDVENPDSVVCCNDAWIVKFNPASVGINELNSGTLFSVYPNPSVDIITIGFNNKVLKETYQITDAIGQILLSGYLDSNTNQVDISNLSAGVYILKVGKDSAKSYKLIKE